MTRLSARNYRRQLQEAAARRRLEIAKLLRDTPSTTNIMLAKALNVSRNTITLDRRVIVEQLSNQTLTETESLRADMVDRLENLNKELELHRKDGKLPISVIHEGLLVTRSIIELLGVRKAVTEQLEVRKRTISFTTTIVGTKTGETREPRVCSVELVQKSLALTEGDQD
jgi:hypothetical protein